MSASSLLVLVLLWSTALDLLSERSGLLAVVDAEAGAAPQQLPDCTATTDGGRCDRIDGNGGCPRVTEGAQECARQSIDLQDNGSGCNCILPDFCDGEQARNITASISITYSVQSYKQFTATASVRNLIGNWNYVMMMTNPEATTIIGNRCTCGFTQNGQVSINRTANFNSVERGSLHLCLRNSSGSRFHYVHNFSIGSECLEFVSHHHLPSHLCNQPVGGNIGRVKNLTIQPTSAPSTLQVSWSKPGIIKLLKLRSETYHLTLNSTQGIHTFNVSDSTSVTCTVEPGLHYTVTVRTRIWCEASSCEEHASASQFIPDLPTPASSTTSHTSPAATSATDHLGLNVTTIVIAGSASGAVLVLLIITVATIVYCQCRIKERYSYSAESPVCSPVESSHTRITNSSSSDLASTPPVDSSSDNSVRISDLVPATSSMHQVPMGSQMIPMEERPQPRAEHHTDSKQVLIVGSQRTSIEDQVQLVAVPLKEYGIKILMYGVESDMDTLQYHRRPTTPSTWVQREMDRAKFVVCICNEEFRDDWCYDGQEMCHEVSLVRSVSQHVAGQMNHGLSSAVESKFVIVVRSEKDSQYIPGGLKNCNVFVLNCEASVQRLVSLLLGVPMVTFT